MASVFLLSLSIFLRLLCFLSRSHLLIFPHIYSRYTDFSRVLEGINYLSLGESPYFENSPVHIPPIPLYLYSYLLHPYAIFSLILIIDLLTCELLYKILRSSEVFFNLLPYIIFLNPFGILATATLDSVVLVRFLILGSIWGCMTRHDLQGFICAGTLIYLDPNYAILASIWYFAYFYKASFLRICLVSQSLLIFSYYLTSYSWDFLFKCQKSTLLDEDIYPNLGLRWYLLLEMFTKYTLLFRVTLAIMPYIVLPPLFSMLRRHRKYTSYKHSTSLYFSVLLSVCFIFHSNPTLGDLYLIILSFLPHSSIISSIKSNFITVKAS